jgi:hypothetical protein
MRLGLIGPSYTVGSSAIADEEAINLYAQSVESQASIVPTSAYGGKNAAGLKSFFYTPGLSTFVTLPGGYAVTGSCEISGRAFVAAGPNFCEILSGGTYVIYGTIAQDGNPASLVSNGQQILIISAGHAYCFNMSTSALLEVTSQLSGVPLKAAYSDSYGIVCFKNSNLFQMSQVLDFSIWPGQLVNEVSVFPENIVSIAVNHRELWVFGARHTQPYQDTGSANIFDVIPGALIETGSGSTFGDVRLDNSLFWVSDDERGGRMCWRSNGYNPGRVSTYAVETDLNSYPTLSNLVAYSYQDRGHLFWVLYIPQSQWSWVYDVVEGMWHKRASWNPNTSKWGPHQSWNHVYAFNRHLVGDWASGNLYTLSANNFTDNGQLIRHLRRSPTIINEMERVYHAELTLDFDMGNLNAVVPSDLPNFAQYLLGPNAPNSAVDTPVTDGEPWQNPGNALLLGEYASVNLPGSELLIGSVYAFDSKLGLPLGPEHYFVLVTFGAPVLVPVGSEFDYSGLTTYTTLNGQNIDSIAGGGAYLPTPTIYQALFTFGTTAIPLQANTADTGVAILPSLTDSSDALDLKFYGFATPATSSPAGIQIRALAYALNAGASLTAQLLSAGVPVGNPLTLPIPTNPTILPFGSIEDLFGYAWNPARLNSVTFGVRLIATCSSAIPNTVQVGFTTISIYAPPPSPTYDYIGPQPALVDGSGNPRPPQVMLRWSDNRGKTWSNEHMLNLGNTGEFNARAIQRRLGQSRYRVYEVSWTDPVPLVLVDGYLRLSG